MDTALFLLLAAAGQFAQAATGELRLSVTDPTGLPLKSRTVLVSEVNQVSQRVETDATGQLVARRLPFGRYWLKVAHDGFATYATLLDIQSTLPLDNVTLSGGTGPRRR